MKIIHLLKVNLESDFKFVLKLNFINWQLGVSMSLLIACCADQVLRQVITFSSGNLAPPKVISHRTREWLMTIFPINEINMIRILWDIT